MPILAKVTVPGLWATMPTCCPWWARPIWLGGFHGGDPLVMRQTLQLAKRNGVSVGAHPSYPDLQGFGRRRMAMAPAELEAAILYQIAALDGMARVEGLRVSHVKPHGALTTPPVPIADWPTPSCGLSGPTIRR